MEEINMLDGDQIRKKSLLMSELLKMLEELYWFKRCYENWLLKGDNNTEFFHRVANGRRRKQSIFFLEYGANHITWTENLVKHATSYYKSLFGPREGIAFNLDPNLWPEGAAVIVLPIVS
jgi:hypothetical protein